MKESHDMVWNILLNRKQQRDAAVYEDVQAEMKGAGGLLEANITLKLMENPQTNGNTVTSHLCF